MHSWISLFRVFRGSFPPYQTEATRRWWDLGNSKHAYVAYTTLHCKIERRFWFFELYLCYEKRTIFALLAAWSSTDFYLLALPRNRCKHAAVIALSLAVCVCVCVCARVCVCACVQFSISVAKTDPIIGDNITKPSVWQCGLAATRTHPVFELCVCVCVCVLPNWNQLHLLRCKLSDFFISELLLLLLPPSWEPKFTHCGRALPRSRPRPCCWPRPLCRPHQQRLQR